ncbi:fas associated factor casp [Lycorma delicatula]|uniref:fas associated factor casp n=1 Tax=Lycorma delicatula TaxID=130591 RepID=UPI003F51A485
MSENKEEILADFQACTGIDDVGEALGHLEESRWDLLTAVNRVMPQETQTLPSEQGPDIEMIEETPPRSASAMINGEVDVGVHVSLSPDFVQVPSTSFNKGSSRLLHFHISYGEQFIQLQIPDSSHVSDLKLMVCSKTHVPVCQQVLTGWKKEPTSDSCVLSSLELPRENLLFLTGPEQDKSASDAMLGELLTKKYSLVIRDETRNKSYNLSFEGSKPIGEIKAAVYNLTDIPVRNQLWSGWPSGIDDRSILAQAGLTQPELKLTVRQKKEYKRIIVDLGVDSDSSVEEFEDASESFTGEDEIFIEEVSSKKQPLIPDNIDDETTGCIHFNDEFTNRFGAMHPEFFPGTLEEAIKEACLRPAKERRLLAVYLHHDNSVLANVFCAQLLCFESVLQYLHSNFVVWGWDLTFESNKVKFLSSVSRNLGSMAAVTVRNIDVERLPALIIIMRMRSNTEIFTVVNGNVGVNELLTSLIQAVDVFSEQQRQEIKEEEERAAREMIKIEQDQAYQASLEIDRAKEEAKQQQILLETQEKLRVEHAKQKAEAKKEAERQLLEKRLPDEPSENSSGVTKIRFRAPAGECLERRFLASNKLQVLLDYLVVKGYHINDYKVISSWPRRDLTTLDINSTLQELNLCPQETLTLEER